MWEGSTSRGRRAAITVVVAVLVSALVLVGGSAQASDTPPTFLTKWGSFGLPDGQFNGPFGIATDSADNVYVSDIGNDRIQKFTSSGTFLTQWGSEGTANGQFSGPRGIATDSAGKVYVADYDNHNIQKFSETIAPRVVNVSPQAGATVSPRANVSATFSEQIDATTITRSTFKLYEKGSTTRVRADVTLDTAKKAVLDPTDNLERGATYRAVITTEVKDLAGNGLDQNPSNPIHQRKGWSFTVSN